MDESLALNDLSWLRRLARSLVRDAASAEDAVQETLVAAWSSGKAPQRGWLAQVLRNAVRQQERSTRRRVAREQRAIQDGVEPPPDDVLAELELHRQLVDLVQALDEPYRETLLLRFLREWSPRRIAGHQGVPVKTVHTRIERGLARLREHLDRTTDRRTWMAALALLDRPHPLALTPLIATAVLLPMQAKLALIVASVAVAALGLPLLLKGGEAVDAGPTAPAERAGPAREVAVVELPSVQRSVLAKAEADSEEVAEEPSALPLLEGFVRDLNGTPVPNVRVVFEGNVRFGAFERAPDATGAKCDAEGRFAIRWDPTVPGRLAADDEGYATLHRPYLRLDRGDEPPPLVIVAPNRRYQGTVVDQEQRPVEGARVLATLPGTTMHALSLDDQAIPLRLPLAETTTDEHGTFALDRVGHLPEAILLARRDGYEDARIELPRETALDLVLTLGEAPVLERTISGRVLNPQGVPQHDARVSLGTGSVATDVEGRFELEVESWREEATLRVFHEEAGGTVEALDPDALRRGLDGEELTVLLPGQGASLSGRVVDSSGRPVSGAVVFTPDTTFFGDAPVQRGNTTSWAVSIFEVLSGGQRGPSGMTLRTLTDEDGRFELTGLLDRPYDLFALATTGLCACGPISAQPGSGPTTLRLEAPGEERIAGRVVNEEGEPVPGVPLVLGRSLPWKREVRPADSWSGVPMMPPTAGYSLQDLELYSDSEGRFELQDMHLDGAWIRLGVQSFFGSSVQLDEVPDPLAIELVHARSARVRLRCRPDATSLRIQPSGGGFLPTFVPVEDAHISVASVRVLEGHALPFTTRAGEVLLVLEREGEVLERKELRLAPGEQTIEL